MPKNGIKLHIFVVTTINLRAPYQKKNCTGKLHSVYFVYYGDKSASSSVSDVDRYVIIIHLLDFIFNIFSGIHSHVGNSDTLTQDFSSVRLPIQGMTYHGS
jgi:hypothetical protein